MPEDTSPHLLLGEQDQPLSAKQYQLLCEPSGTSSCDCKETEKRRVGASHAPRQPLQNVRAPLRAGGGVIDRGNARWTTSKSGHSFNATTCHPIPTSPHTHTHTKWNRISAESFLMPPSPPSPLPPSSRALPR